MKSSLFITELVCWFLQLWFDIWTKRKWKNYSLACLPPDLVYYYSWTLMVHLKPLSLFHSFWFLNAAAGWIIQTYIWVNHCAKIWVWWKTKWLPWTISTRKGWYCVSVSWEVLNGSCIVFQSWNSYVSFYLTLNNKRISINIFSCQVLDFWEVLLTII